MVAGLVRDGTLKLALGMSVQMPDNEGQAETEPKVEKGEPINVIVKDQSGNELHFKVRKSTKFEKVGMEKRDFMHGVQN